jgi:hypothetical protein
MNSARVAVFTLAIVAACAAAPRAQNPGGAAPPTARAAAPIDLTGYWVAFVSEDWRLRMVTPPKGDYTRVPLTAEARKVAASWDPAADDAAGAQCKAFGAGAIMRLPTRLHVTWEDDTTLRLDTDTGTQTRLFRFTAAGAPPGEAPSWQGASRARWEFQSVPRRGDQELVPAGARAARGTGGALTVMTTNLRPGYLRFNGVPYSENAVVTEHFDLAPHPSGGTVLIVTTIVEDPRYLQRPYVVSSQFKKETDGSRWDPTPCTSRW